MCVDDTPEPAAEPSPQFHAYDTTEPSASLDAEPSTDATRPDDDAEKLATGATFAGGWMTTDLVVEPVAPLLSVTVKVTV